MYPGRLTRFNGEHDWQFVKANSNRWKWITISRGSCLFCVEEMFLTKEFIKNLVLSTAPTYRISTETIESSAEQIAIGCMMAMMPVDERIRWRLGAKKEFNNMGQIHGYKFLCPNGKDYVWISHFATAYLLEPNKKE